jgi:hypothetical protein
MNAIVFPSHLIKLDTTAAIMNTGIFSTFHFSVAESESSSDTYYFSTNTMCQANGQLTCGEAVSVEPVGWMARL